MKILRSQRFILSSRHFWCWQDNILDGRSFLLEKVSLSVTLKSSKKHSNFFSIYLSDEPWYGKTRKKSREYRQGPQYPLCFPLYTMANQVNVMSCHNNNSTNRLCNFHLYNRNIYIAQYTLNFYSNPQFLIFMCYFLVTVTQPFNIYNLHTSEFINT